MCQSEYTVVKFLVYHSTVSKPFCKLPNASVRVLPCSLIIKEANSSD